jgi:hypothetical protein
MSNQTNPLNRWLRTLTLELLYKEGVFRYEYEDPFGNYTLEEYWFPFAFGLGGEDVGESGDYWYEEANREGLIVRERVSPLGQQILEDIQCAMPVPDSLMEYDDYLYLQKSWGSLTEAASELGIPIPAEIEEFANESLDK